MSITWANVEELAPEIVGLVPAGVQTYFLALVDKQINDDEWADLADDGRRWLAAHYGSKFATASGSGVVGPVTGETLGPMARTYGTLSAAGATDGDLGTTRYGLEYLRLIQLLPCSLGFVP